MAKIRYFNSTRVRRPLALAIITCMLGLLIAGAAVMSLNRTRVFLAGAQTVQARVVAMQIDRSGKTPDFLPMFAFTDAAGQGHRLPGWQSAPEYGFDKGAQVAVLFNPMQAEQVRIDNWQDTWKSGLTILFVAVFFGGMSLAGLILHRRWMRERPDYATRGDRLPEDGGETIYINSDGRIRMLKNPKATAIMLAIPGLGCLAAGVYGVTTGAEMGDKNQITAFFVGAAVMLGLALWAAMVHRRNQRVRARRGQKNG